LFDERFDMRVIAEQYSRLYAGIVHAYDAAAVTVESCLRASQHHTPPPPRRT
jgi:hypothetical protein